MSMKVSKKLDAQFRKSKKRCLAKSTSSKAILSCIKKDLGSENYERIIYRALSHARKTK